MEISALTHRRHFGGSFAGSYRGPLPEVMGAVESAAASELTGYLVGRYHETLQKTKVPVPLVAGVLLKAGAITLDVMSHGRSNAAVHVHALANAGINTFFALDGVARGYAASGEKLYFGKGVEPGKLPAGTRQADRLWGAGAATAVGHIPQADQGSDWLSDQQLQDWAR